jgi:hypothetical protein
VPHPLALAGAGGCGTVYWHCLALALAPVGRLFILAAYGAAVSADHTATLGLGPVR